MAAIDPLLEQLAADPVGRLVLHYVAERGMWNCYLFLLVAARLAGVFVLAPHFSTNSVPLLARAMLVVLLSLIIAPTLSTGRTSARDVAQVSHESPASKALPTTPTDLACVIGVEVGLGGLLGIGAIAVFSGLRLGGEFLDRHSGLGLGALFNPEFRGGESACGSLAQWMGIAAVLLIEPLGGRCLLLQSLMQSFHAIPVGSASWSMTAIELLNGLVQQSMVLGLRIAMPLIASMMLVDITFAFASRGTSVLGAPSIALRSAVGMVVLALTVTAIPEVIATTMISVLQLFSI